MIDLKKVITLWGVCNLFSVGWYLGWRLIHGQVPFYYDIVKSIRTNTLLGDPSFSIITVFASMLYLSLIFSGVFLIRRHRAGAILSYIQTPFRILTLIPPSIFFIIWPLKYIFEKPDAISAIITGVILLLFSETLKLYSVINWRKKRVNA